MIVPMLLSKALSQILRVGGGVARHVLAHPVIVPAGLAVYAAVVVSKAILRQQQSSYGEHTHPEEPRKAIRGAGRVQATQHGGSLTFYPSSEAMNVFMAPQPTINDLPGIDINRTVCHVILFGYDDHPGMEGIYTVRSDDRIRNGEVTHVDTAISFRTEADGQRFATLLQPLLPYAPTVYPVYLRDLIEWCETYDTRLQLEPEGTLLSPPTAPCPLGHTDWERMLAINGHHVHRVPTSEERETEHPSAYSPVSASRPDAAYAEEGISPQASAGEILEEISLLRDSTGTNSDFFSSGSWSESL